MSPRGGWKRLRLRVSVSRRQANRQSFALLLARSALHRLRLQHEARELRRSVTTPKGMFALATAPAVRPLLFSALLVIVGGRRLARVLQGAMAALAIAKGIHALLGASKSNEARPPAS